ncbi:MAG: potassium-transporting ATPase subunit KdpC [Vicinamibacterales bacterium]
MTREFGYAVRFTVVAMLLFGGAYHAVLWTAGRIAFPRQAEGSLLRRADGTVLGSRLVAQAFARPAYFHPRPSAVDYDAAATGGSNDGPSNLALIAAVRARLDAVTRAEQTPASRVPSEMVTASGSGLDPDIPPQAAAIQAARIARTRGVPPDAVRALIEAHTAPPAFGFLGRARVNVLELNLALDEAFGAPPIAAPGGRE